MGEKKKKKEITSTKPAVSSLGDHKLFVSDKSLATFTCYSVSEQTQVPSSMNAQAPYKE